jgi:hypothetical protein
MSKHGCELARFIKAQSKIDSDVLQVSAKYFYTYAIFSDGFILRQTKIKFFDFRKQSITYPFKVWRKVSNPQKTVWKFSEYKFKNGDKIFSRIK